jgi:hypothetical protein
MKAMRLEADERRALEEQARVNEPVRADLLQKSRLLV